MRTQNETGTELFFVQRQGLNIPGSPFEVRNSTVEDKKGRLRWAMLIVPLRRDRPEVQTQGKEVTVGTFWRRRQEAVLFVFQLSSVTLL